MVEWVVNVSRDALGRVPQLFLGLQSAFTATYTFSLDENSVHLAYIMTELKKCGATRVEASQTAEDAW